MSAVLRRLATRTVAAAYRLAEAELGFVARLPRQLPRLCPGWPVAQTLGLDVGAAFGAYTLALHGWCGETVAIEPNAALARHLQALQLPGLRVLAAAASDAAGDSLLADRSPGTGRHPEARLVSDPGDAAWVQPCRTLRLDSVLPPAPPALVCKIDVEGAELAVLRGMGTLLDLHHLLLIVEIEPRHGPDAPEVFRLLAEHGLRAHQLVGNRLRPTGVEAVAALRVAAADDLPG